MILKNKIIAGLIVMSAANTWAVELPVVNPSFEILSRPLEIGEQTNGAAGDGTPVSTWFPWPGSPTSWDNPVEVSGWRTREVPQGSPDGILAGVVNPPLFQGQPFITEQDGQNVFAIQASQAGQSINALLEPNTRYRVDYLAGIGLNDLEYSPGLTLTAVDDLQRLPLENSPGVQRLAATPFGNLVGTQHFGCKKKSQQKMKITIRFAGILGAHFLPGSDQSAVFPPPRRRQTATLKRFDDCNAPKG